MNANELADAMEIRASIRRKATSRKSVTEGANDRLADQLEQAATMLRQQQAELDRAVELYTDKAIENEALKELLANEGIVVGHDYLNNCIATMRKAQE